jgi:hypothetical protein
MSVTCFSSPESTDRWLFRVLDEFDLWPTWILGLGALSLVLFASYAVTRVNAAFAGRATWRPEAFLAAFPPRLRMSDGCGPIAESSRSDHRWRRRAEHGRRARLRRTTGAASRHERYN